MNEQQHNMLEQRRLELQAALDSAKSQADRNKLGQFSTPSNLAADILRLARTLVPKGKPVRFLDPAFGTGAFYSAILGCLAESRIEWAKGFEIDPHYGRPSQELWKDTPLDLELGDFTTAEPPPCDKDRATLVVCNPPYVRHHHLGVAAKHRLRAASMGAAGVDLNGLTGLYCHFVALSHAWMSKDALAVWLIPSEFMDVNYGKPLKEYLLNRVKLLRIHRFDPDEVQFDDAVVSSAIVVFRNAAPSAHHTVEFTYGGTIAGPRHARVIARSDLRPDAKWTRLAHTPKTQADEHGHVRLGELFTIKRGIATGANDFFVLPDSRARELDLPRRFLRPILPSPRYLRADVIEADDSGSPLIEPRLSLLDCRLPEDVVRRDYPTLWEYLETGRSRKIHEGYLCTHRTPWYLQEPREPAPILCTYMGRVGEDRGAFRFVLNCSNAIAANVYLMLYPRPAIATALRDNPGMLKGLWKALSEIPWAALIGVGRVYGGGLHKMEPKELAETPAGTLLGVLPQFSVRRERQLALSW